MDLPSFIGIGLRYPHYRQVLDQLPEVGWWEVHCENFFSEGGASLQVLTEVRQHYPLSLHGVGLSLGSSEGVQKQHLKRLKALIDKLNPFLVSEHLSWNRIGSVCVPDLLPVPYHSESFGYFCDNINLTQDTLGREILIENPSSYLEFKDSQQAEVEFLVSLCEATGAKILLDVNNIFVSCENHGWDANHYLASIPPSLVKEIHLAGHSFKESSIRLRIDTHDNFVCPEVWQLYQQALQRCGIVPTLLEWDAKIPELAVLISEANKAEEYLKKVPPRGLQNVFS